MRRPQSDPALGAELAALVAPKGSDVPEHLVGVPRCLHKYEPLFRQGRPKAAAPVG